MHLVLPPNNVKCFEFAAPLLVSDPTKILAESIFKEYISVDQTEKEVWCIFKNPCFALKFKI